MRLELKRATFSMFHWWCIPSAIAVRPVGTSARKRAREAPVIALDDTRAIGDFIVGHCGLAPARKRGAA